MHPTRSTPAPVLALIGLLLSLTFPGCGSVPRAGVTRDTPPAAFGLSVTVIRGDAATPNPLHRPARYVLEADGWLRAGTGPGATRETLPPRVRRLTHTQRQRLWDLTRDSGLLDPDCPVRIASGDGPIPTRAHPLLLVTAETGRGRFSCAVALESVLGEPYEPMLEALSGWAWVSVLAD